MFHFSFVITVQLVGSEGHLTSSPSVALNSIQTEQLI